MRPHRLVDSESPSAFVIETQELGPGLVLAVCLQDPSMHAVGEDEDEAVVDLIEVIASRVLH